MTGKKVSFFNINKLPLTVVAIIAAVFTLLGGGRIFAAVLCFSAASIFSMRYLKELQSGDLSDITNRKKLVSHYIISLIIEFAVFAAVFAAGSFIKNLAGFDILFLTTEPLKTETVYSYVGSSLFVAAIAVIYLKILVSCIYTLNDLKKTAVYLAAIYLPILYEVIYLVFLMLSALSPYIELTHKIFLICGGAAFLLTVLISFLTTKRKVKQYIDPLCEPKKKQKHIKNAHC